MPPRMGPRPLRRMMRMARHHHRPHHHHHHRRFRQSPYVMPFDPWLWGYPQDDVAYVAPQGPRPWEQAVQLASVGRNLEAGQLFERVYPDLAGVRGGMLVAQSERSDLYKVALGVNAPGTPVNAQWSSQMLLNAYPSLRWR